jgi:hypothetical protein
VNSHAIRRCTSVSVGHKQAQTGQLLLSPRHLKSRLRSPGPMNKCLSRARTIRYWQRSSAVDVSCTSTSPTVRCSSVQVARPTVMAGFHARSPLTEGNDFHNLLSTLRVSCTDRSPCSVTRKYRLARPPRSGVDSPRLDATRPLSSSRSNAA